MGLGVTPMAMAAVYQHGVNVVAIVVCVCVLFGHSRYMCVYRQAQVRIFL